MVGMTLYLMLVRYKNEINKICHISTSHNSSEFAYNSFSRATFPLKPKDIMLIITPGWLTRCVGPEVTMVKFCVIETTINIDDNFELVKFDQAICYWLRSK